MKNNFEVYNVKLVTDAPVFIGSGKEIGKKEYVFLSRREIAIPKPEALYEFMQKKAKASAFESYMLRPRENLKMFLQNQRMEIRDIESTFAYKLKSDEVIDTTERNLQIMEFVKDGYGMPYVPGSSIKGMLRTVLMAYEISKNPKGYKAIADNIDYELNRPTYGKINRKGVLSKQTTELETKAFRTLVRKEDKLSDPLNDVMQGFVVSDSAPLKVDDLILCQRIELHPDGNEKKMPVYRECIKPGAEIEFTLTIDHSVCKYTKKDIQEAIKLFMEKYYEVFSSKFEIDKPFDNYILLGGGVGYVSKTVIYHLFDEKTAIRKTAQIFEKTGVPENHKHKQDIAKNVSPHVMKCARYNGKMYQMGLCKFII